MQIDRKTVIQQLIDAAIIQEDGCGFFISATTPSEIVDATLAIAQHAAEQEREALITELGKWPGNDATVRFIRARTKEPS